MSDNYGYGSVDLTPVGHFSTQLGVVEANVAPWVRWYRGMYQEI